MILMEFLVVLGCLLLGTRFGGMGLGLISGIGLFLLTFVFGLVPGEPPVKNPSPPACSPAICWNGCLRWLWVPRIRSMPGTVWAAK